MVLEQIKCLVLKKLTKDKKKKQKLVFTVALFMKSFSDESVRKTEQGPRAVHGICIQILEKVLQVLLSWILIQSQES